MKTKTVWRIVLPTVILTFFVVWLVLNLSLGNKQVDSSFEPLYAVQDPQFARSIGSVGKEFSQLLAERARDGVKVHVLLEWIGGQLDDSQLEEMEAHGVEIRRYNAPRWYNLHRLNNRTHRKLLVVDGKVGFIGGVGIADTWRGSAQGP